jgi:peptidoglycan/LPS O-acetylase OafA/YrhL
MRYNPALDGLRAIAVALVIATHCYEPFMPGGWVGVDVFFALSGYLITSILLSEMRQTGGVSLSNFYIRRLLRLTPALAILVVFQLARAAFSHNGSEIREATLIGALYLENWNSVFQFAPADVMGHTWSLAVEEQFYWLWPLTLLFLVKRQPIVWLTAASVAMTIARVAIWKAGYSLPIWQFSPEIRPVGLIIGCILAMIPIQRLRPNALLAPALLAALLAIGFYADSSAYTSLGAPLTASLVTAGLIGCLQHQSAVGGLLSSSPLRYTGKISYGLYLYHWPIFILGESLKIHLPFHLYAAALIALIYAAAVISYEFVEKPFLRLKDRFQGRTAIGIPVGSGLAVRP